MKPSLCDFMPQKKKEGKFIGHIGKIPVDLVDAFDQEADQRGIKKNVLLEEILKNRYHQQPNRGMLPLFPSDKKILEEIIENYDSMSEPWKIVELKKLHDKIKEWQGKFVFYQHQSQGKRDLPNFIIGILDSNPPKEIHIETLDIVKDVLIEVKENKKEQELWCHDIYSHLKELLEDKKTDEKVIKKAIGVLLVMINEKRDLIIIENEKETIDILTYVFNIHERCYSWPNYIQINWNDFFIIERTKKDLKRIKDLIYANKEKVSNDLEQFYKNIVTDIDIELKHLEHPSY